MYPKRIVFIVAFLLLTLGPALFLSDIGARYLGLVSVSPGEPVQETAEVPQ